MTGFRLTDSPDSHRITLTTAAARDARRPRHEERSEIDVILAELGRA